MKASERAKELTKEAISLIEAGKKDEAKLRLKTASNLTKEIKSEYLRPYILNTIAEALFKLGEANEGLQLIQETVNIVDHLAFTSSRLEIFVKIANSLSKINFEPQNAQIHQEALDIAKWIITKPIPTEHIDIPHEAAVLLRNIARTTEDTRMLHEIIVTSKQLDDIYRTMLMRNIAYRLVKLCKNTTDSSFINAISKLVDQIEPSNYRSKTIARIARLLTKTAERTLDLNLIQSALEISDKISSEYYRSKIKSKLLILKDRAENQ